MRLRVRSLALLSGLRIRHCCELWCSRRRGSDPTLLWLWRWLETTAPIRPLAWEPPYAAGAAQEIAKRQKYLVWSAPGIMTIKTQRNQLAPNKFKSFCTAKETIKKMKRQPTEWEKIFAKDPTDKGFYLQNIQTTHKTKQQRTTQ